MKLKFKVLTIIATMIAAPAFAGSFDLSTLTGTGGDLSAIITQGEADYAAAAGTQIYDGNTALISQTADGIITSIDQGFGAGNFVAIIQDATVNAAPLAYISQAGNGNFAVTYQH